MNDRTVQIENQHNCTGHKDHLCYIISQGFHLSDGQGYLALIAEPKFRCSHCGRQAASNRNLCVPMEL